jgi:hypothetical protein
VQATVFRYDEQTRTGAVISDAGLVLPFEPGALLASGLRHLRPGQRLTVELDDDPVAPVVVALRLGSITA